MNALSAIAGLALIYLVVGGLVADPAVALRELKLNRASFLAGSRLGSHIISIYVHEVDGVADLLALALFVINASVLMGVEADLGIALKEQEDLHRVFEDVAVGVVDMVVDLILDVVVDVNQLAVVSCHRGRVLFRIADHKAEAIGAAVNLLL